MGVSMCSSAKDRLATAGCRRACGGFAAVALAGMLALGLGAGAPAGALAEEAASSEAVSAAVVDGDVTLAERVAAQVLPSVGSVYCIIDDGYYGEGISQGSCEVLTADGYILTNYHVIEGGSETLVILGGEAYDAEVVGSDPSSDIAVLKIDPGETELVPIAVGDSSQVRLGQWVMTVGTPFGESETVSVGIVSGLSRVSALMLESTEAYYVGMIQTDAMINSGSSGGALVNAAGELIGVTTLSASESGDWAGMTYAIPSNYAIGLATQIIETGSAQHPRIGVEVTSLVDAYYAGDYDMDESSVSGAYVSSVAAGSGAEAAGVRVGDVITAVDGVEVYAPDELIIQVRANAIGDTVTLTVDRGGETLELDVVLGSDADVDEAADDGGADDAGAPLGGFGWGGTLWGSPDGGWGGSGSDDGRSGGSRGGWGAWGGSGLWDIEPLEQAV